MTGYSEVTVEISESWMQRKAPVRFDEREEETDQVKRIEALGEHLTNRHREGKATMPLLDSTQLDELPQG